MANNAKIEDLIAPILQIHGAYLIELLIRGERGGKVVELYVDTEQGISADTCAQISREVIPILEETGAFQGPYNLTVSSPGLDRPLTFPQQYRRNLGKKLSVNFSSPDGARAVQGELIEANPDFIVIRPEKGDEEKVLLSAVTKALVIPRW